MTEITCVVDNAAKKNSGLVSEHDLAGDLSAADHGEDGITAQDILDYLPPAVKAVWENLNALREKYSSAQVV